MATVFQEASTYYAELGLKVYPLLPREKKPLLKGGFHNATDDIQTVKGIWDKYPYANIAIATGNEGDYSSGIVVIDLDVDIDRDINGVESLKQWEQAQGLKINRNTWVAKTGRGGFHLYYKTDINIKSSTSVVLKGVDIIADLKGIVAPPSIHPNGNGYKWVKDFSPDYKGIAELGNAEYKLLSRAKNSTYTHSNYNNSSAYINNIFNDGIISAGTRNDTIFRKTCKLQSKGLSDYIIRIEVSRYNLEHCNPPLDDTELNTIINSALSRYPKGGVKCWR